MKNSEYWQKRFEELEDRRTKEAAAYYKDVEKQYRIAQNNIERDIERWYQRLAYNNGISYAAAKRLLNKNELAEFKWSVEEYIKKGKENAVNQKWMKELENASARVHISQLEAMKTAIQQHNEILFTQLKTGLTNHLSETLEDTFYRNAFEIAKGTGVGSVVPYLDTKKIEQVLNRTWAADGSRFSDRIWSNKQKLVGKLHTELAQSIIRGEAPDKAIKRLAKEMGVSRKQAGRLIMTETAAISSAASLESYKELGIKQYQILATLDNRTSIICQEMDHKIFDLKDYQVGMTAPPYHPYCRSTTVPYFNDEFTTGEQRSAKDEHTGKTYYVSSDISYKDWVREYVSDNKKGKIKTWNIEEEELNYRKIELDTSSTEIFARQGGYSVEAYKVKNSPHQLYFSTNARKPTRTVNYYENIIRQVEDDLKFDITGMERPNYVIVNGMIEMKGGTAAAYVKKYNTIFLLDSTNTNRLMVQMQRGENENYYACSNNSKSTLMHEMIHWYQFQYAKLKSPNNIKGAIDEQEQHILDYIKRSSYNEIENISDYASFEMIKSPCRVDELIAEALVNFHYGNVNKLVTFIRKEFKK